MRVFDWSRFVQDNHIPCVEKGANVGHGEINIKCPFCGNADPSYHMGLNLQSGFWSCWRNSAHKGKSPLRLLVQLLNVSYWKAKQIAGLTDEYVDPEGFDALAAKLMQYSDRQEIVKTEQKNLKLPESFKLIKNFGRAKKLYKYLCVTRGFAHHTQFVIDNYLLLYDDGQGDMMDRVLFPYIMDGDLVAWSGRAIGNHPVRYKDLPKINCVVAPKKTLYNYDAIPDGGSVLVVVEGPIDTLKMDWAGKNIGVRAVGLSTNSITPDQTCLLEEASSQFDKIVFVLDAKNSGFGAVDSMRVRQKISHIQNTMIAPVPVGFKDCGEMSVEDARYFAEKLNNNRNQ